MKVPKTGTNLSARAVKLVNASKYIPGVPKASYVCLKRSQNEGENFSRTYTVVHCELPCRCASSLANGVETPSPQEAEMRPKGKSSRDARYVGVVGSYGACGSRWWSRAGKQEGACDPASTKSVLPNKTRRIKTYSQFR